MRGPRTDTRRYDAAGRLIGGRHGGDRWTLRRWGKRLAARRRRRRPELRDDTRHPTRTARGWEPGDPLR